VIPIDRAVRRFIASLICVGSSNGSSAILTPFKDVADNRGQVWEHHLELPTQEIVDGGRAASQRHPQIDARNYAGEASFVRRSSQWKSKPPLSDVAPCKNQHYDHRRD
jgi:hypothetical protein